MILECEMFIEKITADTTKEIIRSRRDPIIQVKDIIEYKHDGCAHNRVNNTYHHEFHECLIREQAYFILYRHLNYLIMTFRPFLIYIPFLGFVTIYPFKS